MNDHIERGQLTPPASLLSSLAARKNHPPHPTIVTAPPQRPVSAMSEPSAGPNNPNLMIEQNDSYDVRNAVAAIAALSSSQVVPSIASSMIQALTSTSMTASSATGATPAVISTASSSPITKTNKKQTRRYKRNNKRYNPYNIFFMLERQLMLHARGGGVNALQNPIDTSISPLAHPNKRLILPPLSACRRYTHLPLTNNWFLELQATQQKNKKRLHRKTHGLIPFREMAQTCAKNYREMDFETKRFVNEVVNSLGRHCEELEKIAGKEDRKEKRVEGGKKREDDSMVIVSPVNNKVVLDVGYVDVSTVEMKRKKPALSQDEVATVQQLMGMKKLTPQISAHHPSFAPPFCPSDATAPYIAVAGAPPQVSVRLAAADVYPLAHPRPSLANSKSESLYLQLEQAIIARRESERRIELMNHLLEEQRRRKMPRHVTSDQHIRGYPHRYHSEAHNVHSLQPRFQAGYKPHSLEPLPSTLTSLSGNINHSYLERLEEEMHNEARANRFNIYPSY